MLQKFLLIGVGGSGGKTLRYVWRELDRRLAALDGWDEGMPKGWQFLHIDVPQVVDVIEADVPSDVGDDLGYLGLAEAPQNYAYYDGELVGRAETLSGIAGWRPDPGLDYTNPWDGAGQRRVVGRIITLTQLDRVKSAVRDRVRVLNGGEATGQMQRLSRAIKADPGRRQPHSTTAVVVSSLGGGAGSGAFLDVIDTLRSNAEQGDQWLDHSMMTVLYAADVFSDLDDEDRVGVEPNTLAALSELLAATEHEGPVADTEQSLLAPGLGNVRVRGRRSGRHTYVIGSRNQAVALESSRHVFRSVGKSIATFMIDDDVQHELNSYLVTNNSGRPCSEQFRFAKTGRCSSFGFASVSLGRSLFADYATERLAKRSLDRLLRGYREGIEGSNLRSDELLIADKVERAKSTFFEASGLWELGGEHNQVLDGLRDVQEIKALIEDVVGAVRGSLRERSKLSPGDWRKYIERLFLDHSRDFDASARPILEERAVQWTRDVQENVSSATARFVGREGFDVTAGLLVALDEQVREAAAELRRDRDRLVGEGNGALSSFRYLFDNLVEKVVGSESDSLNAAIKHQRTGLQRRFEAGVRSLAADLLEEVSSDLLPPLQRSLHKAQEDLARAEQSSEFSRLVTQWSTGDVPAHLRKAPNEFLLESQDSAPAMLNGLLDSLEDDGGWEAGESQAIEEIVSGAWPSRIEGGRPPEQRLIETSSVWRPVNDRARQATKAPAKAGFEISLTPASIHSKASAWVRRRRGPLSDFAEETLVEWLSEKHSDAAERAELFADALTQALGAGDPLVSMNPDAHKAVHGDLPADPKRIVSEIPIGPSHRAARRVTAALVEAGIEAQKAEELLKPNSDAREVGVSSFGRRYVHPIVFDSVTGPIGDQWRKCADQYQRDDFWAFRRSRSLPAAMPISASRQRALVRGWLTAEVLGYIDILDGRWSERPLRIWTPRGSRAFPSRLLGPDVSEHGLVLASLIESMPLALITFTGAEDDPIQAYFRLLELGSSADGIGDHSTANPELATWIREGRTVTADPGFEPAPSPRVGDGGATAKERLEAAIGAFTAFERAYRDEIGTQRLTPETTLTVGPSWEIHQLAGSAALELIRSTEAIEVTPASVEPVAIPTPRVRSADNRRA